MFRTDKWDGEDEDDDIKDAWDAESDEEQKSESVDVINHQYFFLLKTLTGQN